MSQPQSSDSFYPGVSIFDGVGMQTRNEFLRPGNDNCAKLAEVASRDLGQPFPIVEVGCSAGRDTWMMAALIASKGREVSIDGIDVNPVVIAEAQKPYLGTLQDLEQRLGNWGISCACLDFFEPVGTDHFRPIDELRQGVRFHTGLNLWRDDLRSGIDSGRFPTAFRGAVINNVFCNLAMSGRTDLIPPMVENIVSGLAPGGILTSVEADMIQPDQHGLTALKTGRSTLGQVRFLQQADHNRTFGSCII